MSSHLSLSRPGAVAYRQEPGLSVAVMWLELSSETGFRLMVKLGACNYVLGVGSPGIIKQPCILARSKEEGRKKEID